MSGERARRAAFLDRDGTLIEDVHYLDDPARVVLIPGVADAIRALHDAEWVVVVVTNQSGIARGLISPAQFAAVTARVGELLADQGAAIDATYHCPHLPASSCDCRKPGPAMYERAARDLGLDLAASLYVGDRWHDVEPAIGFGGRGVLVPSRDTPAEEIERARRDASVANLLGEAVGVSVG